MAISHNVAGGYSHIAMGNIAMGNIAIGNSHIAMGNSHIAMAMVCQGNQSTWRICGTNTPGRLRCDPRSNPIYYGPQAEIG